MFLLPEFCIYKWTAYNVFFNIIILLFTKEYIISLRKMTTLIHTLKMEMILVQIVMTTWMKQPINQEISQKNFWYSSEYLDRLDLIMFYF
jgi:O-antigen ligase